jgi:uncharacterized Zn-finger protein
MNAENLNFSNNQLPIQLVSAHKLPKDDEGKPIKSISCDQCSASFVTEAARKRHLLGVHNINVYRPSNSIGKQSSSNNTLEEEDDDEEQRKVGPQEM